MHKQPEIFKFWDLIFNIKRLLLDTSIIFVSTSELDSLEI